MIAHPRINCCISWGLPFHDIHANYWPVSFIFNSAKCRVTYFPALFSNSTYRNTNITRDGLIMFMLFLIRRYNIVPTRELTMSFVVGYYINTCEQLYLPEIEAGLDFIQSHHGARSISATTRSHQLWPCSRWKLICIFARKWLALSVWWVVVSHIHEMKVYSKMASSLPLVHVREGLVWKNLLDIARTYCFIVCSSPHGCVIHLHPGTKTAMLIS